MNLVSVIVPNYNHAPYLKKRLDSVLEQTYTDLEIIILDDASTDSSVEIIKEYARKDSRITCSFNETNSGNTFKQWEKGFSLAKGEFIWIAESDDYAENTLVATLVKKMMDEPTVGIVYCKSWRIDEQDHKVELLEPWAEEDEKGRWDSDFVNNGMNEISSFPIIGTNIHNTSAVVFRRALISGIDKKYLSFSYSGDWFFWISIMMSTDIGFCAEGLNYYRWHNESVSNRSEKAGIGLYEGFLILNYLNRKVNMNSNVFKQACIPWTNRWSSALTTLSLKMNFLIFWQTFTLDKRIVFNVMKFNLGKLLSGRL